MVQTDFPNKILLEMTDLLEIRSADTAQVLRDQLEMLRENISYLSRESSMDDRNFDKIESLQKALKRVNKLLDSKSESFNRRIDKVLSRDFALLMSDDAVMRLLPETVSFLADNESSANDADSPFGRLVTPFEVRHRVIRHRRVTRLALAVFSQFSISLNRAIKAHKAYRRETDVNHQNRLRSYIIKQCALLYLHVTGKRATGGITSKFTSFTTLVFIGFNLETDGLEEAIQYQFYRKQPSVK